MEEVLLEQLWMRASNTLQRTPTHFIHRVVLPELEEILVLSLTPLLKHCIVIQARPSKVNFLFHDRAFPVVRTAESARL